MRTTTAVALLIFNRPGTTSRVFQAIREARPQRLLVVADGPRPDRPDEAERCAEARAIAEAVDWDCELSTEYSQTNLGCGRRVSSGLDWVFRTVPEAIVLEDDCLPHPSFFEFCDQLLARYRDDERVMHISGDNFQSVRRRGGMVAALRRRLSQRRNGASYYFSRYAHVWGWASWARAWRHYDFRMETWARPEDRERVLGGFSDPAERAFWESTWDSVARGEIDTWDYQWAFACMERGGLSIMPRTNLVSNIGFGDGSTHTGGESEQANLPTASIGSELRHPIELTADANADRHTAGLFFGASG